MMQACPPVVVRDGDDLTLYCGDCSDDKEGLLSFEPNEHEGGSWNLKAKCGECGTAYEFRADAPRSLQGVESDA